MMPLNNKIYLIAPAGASKENGKDLKSLVAYFEGKNFEIQYSQDFLTPENSLLQFHSNSDEYRINDFIKAEQSDADIIFTLRGGYGAAKVIEGLEKSNFKPIKQKTLIGFSDITALHLYTSQKFGWHAIHGAGFLHAGNEKFSPKNMEDVIGIIKSELPLGIISDLQLISANAAEVSGSITGGCLALIQTSISTNWQVNAKGKILVLEDVNEPAYKIDRILHHLKQAHIFDDVKALVYGDVNKDEEIITVLKDFSTKVAFPIYLTNRIGHCFRNTPFIYGNEAKIELIDGKYQLNLDYTL